MTDKQIEQRKMAYSLSGGICAVCGKPLNQGQPQYAHKIANTKANRATYGSFIIDHYMNGEMVCSLKCNDKCNIGFNRGKILNLLADIVIYEIKKGAADE